MLVVLQCERHVLLCLLEAVEGKICLLEIVEVMCCVLICMLEAIEVSTVVVSSL